MFRRKVWRTDAAHKPLTTLRVEELEARITPYVLTGDAWPNPQLITISFVPDGTLLGYNQNGPIYSTLFNDFDSKFGSPATWQKQILLAAQSWADATNINFAIVPDSGVPIGQITGDAYEQGDPTIGDIRIGGFQDTGAGYLAQTFFPPPGNDYSIAGDMTFNTSQPFHIGSTYDLYTVAAHEIGHALGLDESNVPTSIMAPTYSGRYTGLTPDDVAGVEAIYSGGQPRSYDAYNQGLVHNNSFAAAASFPVNGGTAQLTNLDITTVGMNEYFEFVAPAGSSTLHLSIQSSGLSLLSPRVWVYNAAHTQIGYLSGANTYGDTLNVTVTGIAAGKTYFIRVDGSENTALGTGLYDLSMSTGSNPVPSVTLPNTTTPDGNPITTVAPSNDNEETATTITAPSAPSAPSAGMPYGRAMLEAGATPSISAVEQALANYDEWALQYLDHPSPNPLAQKGAKVAANNEAQDSPPEPDLRSGEVPAAGARLS